MRIIISYQADVDYDPNDPCSSTPCYNEAECMDLGDGEFYCFCIDGFSGDLCEEGETVVKKKQL